MEKRLRVGLFNDTFFPMVDGVVMVVDNYARRLSKFCDVVVFVPEGRKLFDDSKLPYKVVRCTKKFPLKFLDYDLPTPKKDKEFLREIENANLDIVHIHSPFTIGKMGMKYAKKHNIPVVATLHSQFKQDFRRAVKLRGLTNIMVSIIMKVFNKCDECWAVNEGVEKLFKKEYKLKAKSKVQYNATDFEKIDFSQQDFDEFDKKYSIQKDEKVFNFVGRLTKLKNIFFIADALKILKDDGFKFKMFFIGCGTDEEALKKKIKKDGLEENVVFTGRITDRKEMAKYYARSNLFLFPSKYDTDGLVKYEAACFGTPTISLKGLECSSNIKNDVNGYLTEDSAKDFAKKIEEIFSDEEKYRQVCKNAHKDLYVTWDNAVENAYKDYLRLINKGDK